ncbi:hypothetical protein B5S33_g927 [[Candida] boidinii]|nr:hypothetical protein B5S27_g4888 [[Candida] boidinii]OWB82303.1 hypothetical protein B5S33_g927 [[Candida] boidinii]
MSQYDLEEPLTSTARPEHDIDDTVNGSWVLDLSEESGKKLSDYDIGNETELSIFNNDDYLKYKSNPEDKW